MSMADPDENTGTVIATAGIATSLHRTLRDIHDGVGRVMASPTAHKVKAYSFAWCSGFAQGLWSYKSTEADLSQQIKHRFMHSFKLAGERVHDASWSHGFIANREMLLIPTQDDWVLVRPGAEELRQLDDSDAEYLRVASQLHATLPHAHVVSICRVQCTETREDFERARNELVQRARRRAWRDADSSSSVDVGKDRDAANVLHLWHGCSRNDPMRMIQDEYPFDFRLSRNGLWGRAAYFACEAKYSNNYAHVLATSPHGISLRQLFLAEVALGHAEHRSQGAIERPSPGYDSVTGWAGNTQVYMLYDLRRAYPTYLVTYEVCE